MHLLIPEVFAIHVFVPGRLVDRPPAGFHDDPDIVDKNVSEQEVSIFISEVYPGIGQGQLADFYIPEKFKHWGTRYNGLLKYQGFAKALLSTRKNYQLMEPTHQAIHQNQTKTSFMWGTHDSVLPLNEVRIKINDLLPDAKLYEFSQSGHLPHMEEEEKFNQILFEEILK